MGSALQEYTGEHVGIESYLHTDPQAGRVHPRRERISTGVLGGRIMVVSPFSQFNAYYEVRIPQALPGTTVDIIERSDAVEAPFFDIAEYEKDKPRPLAVIDTGLIRTSVPSPADIARVARELYASIINKRTLDAEDPFKFVYGKNDTLTYAANTPLSFKLSDDFKLAGIDFANEFPNVVAKLRRCAARIVPYDDIGIYFWARKVPILNVGKTEQAAFLTEAKNSDGTHDPHAVSAMKHDAFLRDTLQWLRDSLRMPLEE